MFDCVVKIMMENYFLRLVLNVKNLFSEKGNTSQPPTTATTKEKHNPPPTTQNPNREEEKKSLSLLRYHQNTTTHTTTITTKSKIKEKEYQTQKYVGGLVRVREKKWDEKMKTTVEKRGRVRSIEERDGETVPNQAMAVVDRVHAELEEVFDWSAVRWSEKMREKLTVGWEENGGKVCWRAWWSTACNGMQSVVKIEAQPVLVDAWLAIGEVGLRCLWICDEGGVGWDLQVCDVCEEWAGGRWQLD